MPASGRQRVPCARIHCAAALVLALGLTGLGSACSRTTLRRMEVTGYCGCGTCCDWERGSWQYLKLDFWNRYITAGPRHGHPYSGLTASGTKPHAPQPGLLSLDTARRPWLLPVRLIFPWLWLARDGTVAADTRHYPFGTRMYVPGYGWGVVADRGGAIKGPRRLDLYFRSHRQARRWGRQTLEVRFAD